MKRLAVFNENIKNKYREIQSRSFLGLCVNCDNVRRKTSKFCQECSDKYNEKR